MYSSVPVSLEMSQKVFLQGLGPLAVQCCRWPISRSPFISTGNSCYFYDRFVEFRRFIRTTSYIARLCVPERLINWDVLRRSQSSLKPRNLSTKGDERLTIDSDLVRRYLRNLLAEARGGNEDSAALPESARGFSSTERSGLGWLASRFALYEQKEEELSELKRIVTECGNDKEVFKMAEDDIVEVKEQLLSLELEIFELLLPKDVANQDEVLLEVSSGVGGQEAMLFTKQIFDMYCNYAAYKNWTIQVFNYEETDAGGLRHAAASIIGRNAYRRLKFEGGVHRVQRVPKTERSGRIHTSTMTVAVMPQPSEIDIVISPKDLRVDTFRAAGKGGQHVNTTDSAVRIVHLPTDTVAECQTERSQIRNRETAMKILRSRLYEKELEKQTQKQSMTRKLQVGSANRNEKIRTYNFKDDRVSDHRVGKNIYDVEDLLCGGEKLDNLINMLDKESQHEILLEKLQSSITP